MHTNEPIRRQLDEVIPRFLAPLLSARPRPGGWALVNWDGEQGVSLVFARGDQHVLVELEARDEGRDCSERTSKFNICARATLGAARDLTADERILVAGVAKFVRQREHLLRLDDSSVPSKSRVREIQVDRMLMAEGRGRYYLNPYSGCMVGCAYCYVGPRAEFSSRIDGDVAPAFGSWVDVKINAAETLRAEVQTATPGLVRMSPILTEPYQPIEKKYRITRQCIEILLEHGFTPLILTRESRVLDDLELLAKGGAVGFSIPTDDDGIRKIFEPRADTIDNRIAALKRCHDAGLVTCLVVQPAMPMNVSNFVERTAPHVSAVRVDRMHFSDAVAKQCAEANMAEDDGQAIVEQLVAAYTDRGVEVDVSDDLGGIVERLLRERKVHSG